MARVSEYLHRKASINKIPLSGCFELSPICNLACKMCYVRKTAVQIQKEGKCIKKWDEWLSLAEECRKEGTLYLLLTGGEPFLYPDFKKLYMALHEMGFVLAINTNGTMIDKDAIEWLKKAAPSRVNITLYGASSETYRRISGRSDAYEKAVFAILELKKAGIPVVINASMIPENAPDLEQILEFGKKHGINVRMSTYMFPPVRRIQEKDDSRFSPKEASEMYLRKMKCQFSDSECVLALQEQLDTLKTTDDDQDSWGHSKEYMHCRAGRSSFWVSWDGIMTACGMLPFPIEEYPFERPFRDCWMELTDKVRTTPVLAECAGCEKKKICNPCVAMLYAETGDVNCRAPYLCEMADNIINGIKTELKEGIDDE